MKFAVPLWLFGTGLALVIAIALVAGGVLASRNLRKFGEEALVRGLLTANPRGRRAAKGVLLVLAVALAFVALAQPQYGRGTRLIPATNLDVVVVLDYSKSMYARDIAPSRTLRAKAEVSRLIQDLPGVRFGAVAFAGDAMAFPLTSDGASIAQFLRQITPNDMPVGGTAIGRALESGLELLERDPVSKQHKRVMLLVTDGEDLEGDPLAVAESAKQADVTIDVVQIGGRTPEPIPDVNEAGESRGYRMDEQGRPLTTSLSADGEAQLTKIASTTGGVVVRSERGETGITEIAQRLRRLVTEELSEKVETVYADVYMYPLGLAVLLLVIETFIGESRRRAQAARVPPPARRKLKRRVRRAAAASGVLLLTLLPGACARGTDALFERNAPEVDQALHSLDAGDAGSAVGLLESYLSTGKCDNGEIGTPDSVRSRPNAGFDLGLGLFQLGERFGRRFGDEESSGDGGLSPEQEAALGRRAQEVECALRIVRSIAGDAQQPIELRARAEYLAGNLEFLRRDYRSAVKRYDASLRLIPGLPEDGGDGIGRDAAYNRAIALRRIADQARDAGPDSGHDAGADAGPPDGGGDGGRPDGGDGGPNQKPKPDEDENKNKQQNKKDQDNKGQQDGGQNPDQKHGPDAGAKPPEHDGGQGDEPPEPQQRPTQSQDDRMLDMLEQTPTYQEQSAKNRRAHGRVAVPSEDK